VVVMTEQELSGVQPLLEGSERGLGIPYVRKPSATLFRVVLQGG